VSKLNDAVFAAIVVHDATQRKPPNSTVTFFGRYDLWMYHAVLDDKLCDLCLAHEKHPRYLGWHLRLFFPYLKYVNDNKLMANVHPHCRCYLTRVTDWTLDDIKWFVNLEID